ncbi:helix-turn-helix domain-containing protein [Desulfosporosinus sp. BICA1-9]|uniref:helix-turn-helix domain-containing protein n=1 Tax=Desulfosporosinus sp. BICA1-9 TaxID=1531958 RepID=UPI000AD034AE|nr:helix-turn-helix transcriptional regulator [Desulfosporosinus sp. BICA1-9]
MAVGDRIKRIRNLRGLTQKELGLAIGFDDKTATCVLRNMNPAHEHPKRKC